jgi:hypothetical protein
MESQRCKEIAICSEWGSEGEKYHAEIVGLSNSSGAKHFEALPPISTQFLYQDSQIYPA